MLNEQRNKEVDQPAYAKDRIKKKDIELSDGSKYSGEMYNEEPDGEGVRQWPNLESNSTIKPSKYMIKYEGTFKSGKCEGYGKA